MHWNRLKYITGAIYFQRDLILAVEGKTQNTGQLDIWVSGYLDIWIFGYLDIWIHVYLDIWILVK